MVRRLARKLEDGTYEIQIAVKPMFCEIARLGCDPRRRPERKANRSSTHLNVVQVLLDGCPCTSAPCVRGNVALVGGECRVGLRECEAVSKDSNDRCRSVVASQDSRTEEID